LIGINNIKTIEDVESKIDTDVKIVSMNEKYLS